MRWIMPMPMLILFLLATTVEAQSPPSAGNSTRRMRSLFGALLIDKDLQKELRMTPGQVKRMQEIFVQYASPNSVIFSSWGIKQLGITEEQRQRIKEMSLQNGQEKLKVLLDKSGKYTPLERLNKAKEMDVAFSKKGLSVLTRSQRDKYEQLKGKPYTVRMLTPPRRKPTRKAPAKASRR